MSNEVLLAILSFGLGVLATIITQIFSRRWRLADAKRKRKLENLRQVREWMEAYRTLFRCKYPDLFELVFSYDYLNPNFPLFDKVAPELVYQALKEFQEASAKLEEKERIGREALHELGEWKWHRFDRFLLIVMHGIRHYPSYLLFYPRGFPRKIAPHLEDLLKLKYKSFERFPDYFLYRINWDKLDAIQPSEVNTLLRLRFRNRHNDSLSNETQSQYVLPEADLADARENVAGYKGRAVSLIDDILREIRKHENKWIIPE